MENRIIVAFHIGRGGRFNNQGHKSYIGERDFQDLVKSNSDELFIVNRNKDGKFCKPYYVNGAGNRVSDDPINAKVGILDFDGEYDTDIARYIEDCTDEEIDLIRDSREYKSPELEAWLNA